MLQYGLKSNKTIITLFRNATDPNSKGSFANLLNKGLQSQYASYFVHFIEGDYALCGFIYGGIFQVQLFEIENNIVGRVPLTL